MDRRNAYYGSAEFIMDDMKKAFKDEF